MGFFERDPLHAVQIHAVILCEDAADPHCRRDRIGTDADPAPGQAARRKTAALCVVDQIRVLKARKDHGGKERERLSMRLRHQEGDDCQFGDVEFEVAHQALERGVGHLHVGKCQRYVRGLDLAALEREGGGVIPEQRMQAKRVGRVHRQRLAEWRRDTATKGITGSSWRGGRLTPALRPAETAHFE